MYNSTAPNEAPNPSPDNHQVAQAIDWLVKFEAGGIAAADQQAFQHWLAKNPLHNIAWQRLGQASQRFTTAGLGSEQALHSLNAAEQQLQEKRRTLKVLSAISGLGIATWITRDYTGAAQAGRNVYGQALADLSTTVGQQKNLTLDDGSQLTLNTQSAMDINFNAQPPLVLHFGELAIQNSYGAQLRAGNNLFSPDAGSGFTLFRQGNHCRLQVITGRVNCILGGGNSYQISAGEGVVQQGQTINQFTVDPNTLSWRQGMLTAERTSLSDFVAQLRRYKPGHLSCDDAISPLTLSGSFPIANTDAILDNLCQILPIRQQRLSRYWVRLLPA